MKNGIIQVGSPIVGDGARITITDSNNAVIARWKLNADQMRLLKALEDIDLLNGAVVHEPDYKFERI